MSSIPGVSSIDVRLRPEASAVNWLSLNESQREAFRRVLYMMDEAIAAIPAVAQSQRCGPELIQQHRSSKSAFITGSRGSGKTSVLLSLMQAVLDKNLKIPYESSREKFDPALNIARKRLVWLEPIDLDPLPTPFSLIPSILDRVLQALHRTKARMGGSGESSAQRVLEHDLLLRYQDVYRETTLAWDSNVMERKSRLDPEYYAHEIQKTNSARLSLSQRVDELLAAISAQALQPYGIENPLFVISIDDFDLHPTASLHILRMLRMLSSPRLFFLMLGDIQILELMSDLGVSSEIGNVLAKDVPPETLGIQPEQISKLGGSISRNVLRKLLPAEQRVQLDAPDIPEGLLYRPSHHRFDEPATSRVEGFSIAELCHNIPFRVNSELLPSGWEVCETRVLSLFDYLFHPGFQVFSSQDEWKLVKEDAIYKVEDENWPKANELVEHFSHLRSISSNHRALTLQSIDGRSTSLDLGDQSVRAEQVSEFSRTIERQFSWANHLFETTPRRLADFWFAFRRQATFATREFSNLSSDEEDKTEVVFERIDALIRRDLARMCRDALLEETAFTPKDRERITAALTPSSIGDFNWSELPLRLVTVTQPPLVINGDGWAANRKRVETDGTVRNLYHEIRLSRVDNWAVIAEKDKTTQASSSRNENIWAAIAERDETTQTSSSRSENIDASRELSPSTASLVMLLHDRLKLCTHRNSLFETNLIPGDDGALSADMQFYNSAVPEDRAKQDDHFWCKWASTQYRGSYQNRRDLYWPAPSSMSIWSMDQFRRCWNRTLEQYEKFEEIPTLKLRSEALAFAWISAGCAVTDGLAAVSLDSIPTFLDWSRLHNRLNQIVLGYKKERRGGESENVRCKKNWLQNVAVLMMPEMGLPTHLMFQLLFGLNVPSYEQPDAYGENTVEDLQRGNQFRALKYSLDVQHALYEKVVEVAQSKKTEEAKVAREIRGYFTKQSANPKNQTSADHLDRRNYHTLTLESSTNSETVNKVTSWLVGQSPFIGFMQEGKTEIRARRGVRLALLGHIAEGDLSKRLRRSSAIFLADIEHHERLGESCEYGDQKWDVGDLCVDGSKVKGAWDNYIQETTPETLRGLFTTGLLFRGGGLVPHDNEIPFRFDQKRGQ